MTMSASTSYSDMEIIPQDTDVTLENTLKLLKDLKLERDEKLREICDMQLNNQFSVPLRKSASESDIINKQQKLNQSFINAVREDAFQYYQVPSNSDLHATALARLENDVQKLFELSQKTQEQLQDTQQNINRMINEQLGMENMKKACLQVNDAIGSKTWEKELEVAHKIFLEVKNDLHEVVSMIFPNNENVRDFLSDLCTAHFRKGDDLYIDQLPEFADVANFLLEADLIAYDPYDKTKVRLVSLL